MTILIVWRFIFNTICVFYCNSCSRSYILTEQFESLGCPGAPQGLDENGKASEKAIIEGVCVTFGSLPLF